MSEEQVVDESGISGNPAAHEASEKEARLLGWIPEDEFKGPPEKWRPAEEFLEEGKRINGFLRKDMEKLRAELMRRDQTVAEMQATMKEFAAFHQQTEQKAYERALRELKEERKAALREGDGEKVVEIEDRMEQLEEAAPAAPKVPKGPQAPAEDPVWNAWVSENSWFRDNVKLRALTNSYGDILRAEGSTLVGRPFLDAVKARVQADFPEHFENGERKKAAAVGGSGENRGGGSGKGYSALPPEAKAACDKFVKQGLVASREAYAKDYFGE